MPRPRLCLCNHIRFNPEVDFFKPSGVPLRDLEIFDLSIEELEACRLRHTENLDQIAAAKRMHTSQSSYQRILQSAYDKIVKALVEGKAIRIVRHSKEFAILY